MIVRADTLQQCAHNGVVAGSNPAGPTTETLFSPSDREFGPKPRGSAGFGRSRVDGRRRYQSKISPNGRKSLRAILPSTRQAIKDEMRRVFYPDLDDWKALVWHQANEVVEARGHMGVLGSQGFFQDRQRALEERLGLRIAACAGRARRRTPRRPGDPVAAFGVPIPNTGPPNSGRHSSD